MIKTLIELFDNSQLENVIAGLRFSPEKIIFVGFKKIMTQEKCDAISDFFKNRGINSKIDFQIVPRYDIDLIIKTFNTILDNNEDCYIDLTGGRELVLTAIGTILAEREVPAFQYDFENDKFKGIRNCKDITGAVSFMSIDEAVELNLCTVNHQEKDDFSWELTNDFENDVEKMWFACRRNCGLWNRQTSVLSCMEKFGKVDFKNLSAWVNLSHLKHCRQDNMTDRALLEELEEKGIISELFLTSEELSFKFKSEQVWECLSKAGNVLELYSYIILKEIEAENPEFFDDIDIGVYIVWDDEIHEEKSGKKDTKNEVDIVLMRDLIPFFISCKNGEVKKEALYELETVSERFGGKYAKKVLFSTYVNGNPESREYIRQRAEDMGIIMIDNLHDKTREKIKEDFIKYIK